MTTLRATVDLLDLAAAAANEEESDDKDVDGEESADTDDDGDENEEEINKPSNLELKMIQNSKNIGLGSSALAIEFLELINSLCINLLSTNFKDLFKQVIDAMTYEDILKQCSTNEKRFKQVAKKN